MLTNLTPGHGADTDDHRRARADWQRRNGLARHHLSHIIASLDAQSRAQAEAERAERERAEHSTDPGAPALVIPTEER